MSDLETPSASLIFRLKSVSVEKLLSVESMPLASAVLMCHQAADILEGQQRLIQEQKQYVGEAGTRAANYKSRIEELKTANERRKTLNAQMLMNAAESGNRNYLAEIEALQAKLAIADEALGTLSDPDWYDGETINTAMDYARAKREEIK